MNRLGTPVHILHVGKMGGTALLTALEHVAHEFGIVCHDHFFRLQDIPQEDWAVVIVRDPTTRFVSAFNSRLRLGRPRANFEWTLEEAVAFTRFPTPNALAEALSSDDPNEFEATRAAMKGIFHVNMPLTYWLVDKDTLKARSSRLLVCLQEQLDDDFERLKTLFGLPPNIRLPGDPIQAHRTPAEFSTWLSELGRQNVRRWYADDVILYEMCQSMHARWTAGLRQHG